MSVSLSEEASFFYQEGGFFNRYFSLYPITDYSQVRFMSYLKISFFPTLLFFVKKLLMTFSDL
ncbi:hypothetical protein AZF04_16460 [Alkalihalobacillus trypoxylicola]|uniref:Uncharacterized protein n=1 Tax=Alkalihalobacillus trypoxylicola TaxID=519424 RepID=A0A161PJM4_9BACI|nr:hypothetical protein AZF04_16460 [Alkalihalobacillus trypoxylicola]